MTKDEAIQFLNEVAQAIYKQGSVQMTPEVYEKLSEAIKVLEK